MDIWAVLLGFMVGGVVGMTGVGGGSLMTPMLIGVFRLSPALAIGTDLWFAALTKSGGSVAHAKLGHVQWRIVGLTLAGSLPAALLTLGWLKAHGDGTPPGSMLTASLGIALLLTALTVFYRRAWSALGLRIERHLSPRRRDGLTFLAGLLLGVLVTLSSIGAGAIGATLILLLYPRLPAQQVVGTDIAHAVPLTLLAGIGYAWLGLVDWGLLAALLIGSLPGIWLGSRATRLLPEHWVRVLLCGSLLGAGVKVLA